MADPVTTGLVVAGTLGAAKRVEDFIAAISGHPGESLGTFLGNIANRRLKYAESVLSKSHLILLDIGEKPCEIPLNILQPVLEGASLQEDPDLQNTWANLLANAADPRQLNPVLPSFANMLKELTTREVKFLEALLDVMPNKEPYDRFWPDRATGGYSPEQLMHICSHAKLFRYDGDLSHMTAAEWKANEAILMADYRDFAEMMGVLKRNGILDEIIHPKPIDVASPLVEAIEMRVNPPNIDVETQKFYKLSALGTAFLNACRRPSKAIS